INSNLDNVESSLGVLNNWNVSQDASLALKANISDTYTRTYIDGSLAAKQDIITDGTFLKESSIGDGLFWVDGQLDVSVEGGGGSTTLEALTDTSVAGRSSGDFLYYNNDTSTWDNISSIDISTIYENAVDHFIQGVGNLIEVSIGNSIPDGSTLIWMADGEYWGVGSVPTDFYSQTYVDGSLNAKAGLTDLPTDFYSQAYVDGSLGTLQGVNTSQDASIVILRNKDIDIDASIGLINTNLDNIETSLGVINGWNVSQDASIDELRNKDISQDASIVLKADKTYVDANFVPNASIGDGLVWNAGQLDVSVAGGAQDPSIGDLYSIKENKTDVDSSLADVYTFIGDIPQDASIPNLYSVKADKTEIPTDFYSQAYVDGSLGTLQGVNTAQDASIVILRNKDIDIDASIVALRTTNNNQDTSIGILNNWNVSQDASLVLKANSADVYSKTYIDGSLNAKQNTIPAGTYVKEASLGDGLEWNAGMLDVSIESITSMAELTDVSLVGLADKDTLVYNSASAVWENEFTIDISDLLPSYSLAYIDGSFAQRDTSIEDIYNTKQDIITDGTYVKE
ncbi:MAG TPA: hypothetical protein PK122_04610, partial [Candidatus Paceibacterota bacterium]|nr:hypothetical protein [Candidatus Paceibacterota bacterium]